MHFFKKPFTLKKDGSATITQGVRERVNEGKDCLQGGMKKGQKEERVLKEKTEI